MIIKQRRIRNLESRFHSLQKGDIIVVCLENPQAYVETLKQAGFSAHLELGERVLPASCFSARSRFNAHGGYQIHRDQPKEIAYRTTEWHWQEFHGPYDRVEQSKFVDVPYPRFPRTFIPPPSIEFTIQSTTDGRKIITTEGIQYIEDNYAKILHRINLFLEIFGICEIRNENLYQFQLIRADLIHGNKHKLESSSC